eukprot:scaffold183_cov174-Ochromonas_danica.AAC.2
MRRSRSSSIDRWAYGLLILITLMSQIPSGNALSYGDFSTTENEGKGCGCAMARGDHHSQQESLPAQTDSADRNDGIVDATGSEKRVLGEVPEVRKALLDLPQGSVTEDLVFIPGGLSYIGVDDPVIIRDGEGPRRQVDLSPFYIDRYSVTNEAVPEHISSTITQAVLGSEWWYPVNGSYWREPEGPGTDVFTSNRSDHPVVQVSWNDAKAYCEWRGSRLPTEAEWEIASTGPERRSKRKLPRFPWGNALVPNGTHRMNVFQGEFPTYNSMDDGYAFTCPVTAYGPQNSYGVYNMMGNVWEWVEDWWTIDHAFETEHVVLHNPRGPPEGKDKVKKGGSFLCHRSYCYRYRLGCRFQSTPDTASLNIGFRCAKSREEENEL